MAGQWSEWTPEEDAAIREHYPAHGPRWDGWQRLLRGHHADYANVMSRARRLGVMMDNPTRGKRRWPDARYAELLRHVERVAGEMGTTPWDVLCACSNLCQRAYKMRREAADA